MNMIADLDGALATIGQPQRIVRRCAEHTADVTEIPIEEIRGQSRVRPVAWARQSVYYAAHMNGVSLSEIGKYFNRDHTSVLHGIRAVKKRITAAN